MLVFKFSPKLWFDKFMKNVKRNINYQNFFVVFKKVNVYLWKKWKFTKSVIRNIIISQNFFLWCKNKEQLLLLKGLLFCWSIHLAVQCKLMYFEVSLLFKIYFSGFCLLWYCVLYVFQAVSSIVCGFILALAATVLLIQVKKWQMISTLWPGFGKIISKPYLITYESKSIFVNFLFNSFQYTRTSLWSNMKPRFAFTNHQLLWNSEVIFEQLYPKSTWR